MNPISSIFRLAIAPKHHRTRPLRVAAIYLIFGVLWILLSDSAINALGLAKETANWIQSIKGITFVLLSAALLYIVSLREIRGAVRANDILRSVCDGASDAIYVKDLKGRYLLCNPAAAKLVGKSVNELIGQDDFYLFDAASAHWLMEHDRRIIAADRAETAEENVATGGVTRTFLSTKGPFRDESGKVIGLIGVSHDITERINSEKSLREREALFRAIIETSADGFLMADADGRILDINEAYAQQSGFSRQELLAMNLADLEPPEHREEAKQRIESIVKQGHERFESNHQRASGQLWPVEVVSTFRPFAGGRLFLFCRDITRRKQIEQSRRELEQQLHQSQKMEAIGLLAGGVAHDFNNVLTVISGFSEILLGELPAGDPRRASVEMIQEAGDRAADLTRQLLAFSRQSVLAPRVLDLNEVVRDTEKLLRRMIGEDIVLTTTLEPALARVQVDPTQIGQVLMNLAVNARDAMPQGGQLQVTTQNVPASETSPAGVLLMVADNGHGMPDDVKARIFEPFFTTKGPWKGTGIGLATVYGIVQQSGGQIEVASAVDHGTTFRVYLPAVADAATAPSAGQSIAALASGKETILLVEDDASVRKLSAGALQKLGYDVIATEDGRSALKLLESHQGRIDLLVTDVVMPEISGRQLAEELTSRLPDLQVLYVSGYTDDAVVRHGVLQAEVAFLQKPYTPQQLARKVREVLDAA